MTLTIRDATPDDEDGWRRLWGAYLGFYDLDLAPEITAATWARVMDPDSPMKLRLALRDGRIAGFALHQNHPSSWVAGDDCYLEDLFVDEAARGAGIGKALIDDLIVLARTRGWHRLYWFTHEGNRRARALYDRYTLSDGHIRYRIKL